MIFYCSFPIFFIIAHRIILPQFVTFSRTSYYTLGDTNDFNGSDSFYGEFTRFCDAPHEPKLNLSYPVGGYFAGIDVFMNEPARPTRFFSP
jgi:hypothetical protein